MYYISITIAVELLLESNSRRAYTVFLGIIRDFLIAHYLIAWSQKWRHIYLHQLILYDNQQTEFKYRL